MGASEDQGAGLAAQRSTAPRPSGFRLAVHRSTALPLLLLMHTAAVSAQPAPGLSGIPAQSGPSLTSTDQPLPPPIASPPARLSTGLVTIESDLQRADQATGVVTAMGNVRIVYPDQRVVATARQAQYFSKEGRVVLSGDVDIVQTGGNLLRAERVVYLVESERLIAIPPEGQQVFSQMRLEPVAPTAPSPRP